MPDREQIVLARLEEQIVWYNGRSNTNQRYYQLLKITTMGAAGLVPVLAGFAVRSEIVGVFGFLALLCEGLQQLNQYHSNWIRYRSTCEALKHEKHLYMGRAGHYRGVEDPVTLLAEQVESQVSVEHAKWTSVHQEPENKKPTHSE